MTSTPKFSITAVIIGLLFVATGTWSLATDIKLWTAATYIKMEVVSQRDAICPGGRSRDYPCIYPTVAHTDAEGRKHSFKLNPRETVRFRYELKKSKNQMEVLYIPNGPSPDDDLVFENHWILLFQALACLFVGIVLIEQERRDLIRIRKLAALPTGPPDSFLHIGKRRN